MDWCWSWSSNPLATWCEDPTYWKRLWCWKRPWWWERPKAMGEEGKGGWGGWLASLTQWMWVWANSGRWRRTGKPGLLQSMGLQRVRHDLVTGQQQQQEIHIYSYNLSCLISISFYSLWFFMLLVSFVVCFLLHRFVFSLYLSFIFWNSVFSFKILLVVTFKIKKK